jgi:hypothetical protein
MSLPFSHIVSREIHVIYFGVKIAPPTIESFASSAVLFVLNALLIVVGTILELMLLRMDRNGGVSTATKRKLV